MSSQVCISFAHSSCCLAVAQNNQQQVDSGIFYDDLKDRVRARQLTSVQTLAVLADGDYQLLKAKKPDVPESKIKEALLWQEQARFSLPVDQIILEYFEYREANGEQKFYLVAVAKQQLQAKYQLLNASGLKLTRITIPELVYASYVQANLSQYASVIWVNLFADQSRALLFANGSLASTLRLPILEQEAVGQALKLFYHEQALAFVKPGVKTRIAQSNPSSDHEADNILCVINSLDGNLSKALLADLDGKMGKVKLFDFPIDNVENSAGDSSISVSHAVYGVLTER